MEKGLQLVLATAFISGVSIFANKFGVAGINSSIYALSRSLFVALLIAAVLFAFGSWKKLKLLSHKDWLGLVAVGLVGGSAPFLLFFRGLQLASAAQASFIHKSMFIPVALLAFLFLKEKLDWKIAIGAALLFAGNALLLGVAGVSWDFGSTLVLAAMLLWAVENVLSKKLLSTIDANALAFGRMFFGALFIAAWLSFTGELQLAATLSQQQLSWIAASSLLLLAYVFTWYNGLKTVPVTVATSVLLLGAPITLALNYFFSNAAITPLQIVGSLLLLSGVVLFVHQPLQQAVLTT